MKIIITAFLTLVTFISYAQNTSWSEYKLKEYWKKNGAEEIEGIYIREKYILNCNGFGNCKENKIKNKHNFYILKKGEGYIIGSFSGNFTKPLIKAVGSNKYFLTVNAENWFGANDKNITLNFYLNDLNELVSEKMTFYQGYAKATFKDKFSSIYKPEKKPKIEKKQKSSGTGFSISSNGIIVTNFHVIDGTNSIKVRGINSDFNKTYKAKVLVSDKNNDLAIIQIDDYSFTSLGEIPYTIKSELVDVGENIFVLGYPLRTSMGDEIKLTNGIVSSRTGFQGDITSYQISAPVHPGNSGGPLFDSQGNLIGIINAKHAGAENASYAVKSSYLTNLFDLLPNSLKLQTVNSLTGKTLSQQVNLINKYVYVIETE